MLSYGLYSHLQDSSWRKSDVGLTINESSDKKSILGFSLVFLSLGSFHPIRIAIFMFFN